jgi:predicted nucleotide-binding protein
VASAKRPKASKVEPNTVFVVHGRDRAVADSMFQLLRALGLNPIESNVAIGYTRTAAPSIMQIITKAFERAAAAVCVFTPDEEIELKQQFRDPADEDDSRRWSQARPNVYFEAGIALALRPTATVLVEVGRVRYFSDVGGVHVARLGQSATSRNDFVVKLRNAGLAPNTTGNHWLSVGTFTPTLGLKETAAAANKAITAAGRKRR